MMTKRKPLGWRNSRVVNAVHTLLLENGPMTTREILDWLHDNKSRGFQTTPTALSQLIAKRKHMFRSPGQATSRYVCGTQGQVKLWEAIPQEVDE